MKKERKWPPTLEFEPEALDESEEPELPPDKLTRLLDKLSPASRLVIELHYNQDLPLPEVACVLQIPLGTVKSRLAYGLKQLRKHVNTIRK